MAELEVLTAWIKSRLGQRDEQGFTAVEWLVIALGVITIAGVAVAAVQAYVTGQSNKLNH